VEASIRAKHRVEIHAPATFRGSILTPSLRVDEGVIFEGSSRMVSSTFREDGAQAGPRSSRLSKPKS
jgi:cytoskeletal protein CcmA (bactofilin family)